jgi:hypothetical protein
MNTGDSEGLTGGLYVTVKTETSATVGERIPLNLMFMGLCIVIIF